MKQWLKWLAPCLTAVAIVAAVGFSGYFRGYKEGQIDYALNRIEYTVIEGKVIHIMGDAPGPEIKLSPIEEKGK